MSININQEFPKEMKSGAFKRQKSVFRNLISKSNRFKPEPNRYHFYLSYACPWAHRVMITIGLKGLENIFSYSFVNPIRDSKGWRFDKKNNYIDTLNSFDYLSEAYMMMDPNYNLRITVPVMWDKFSNEIVNNESSDIIEMINSQFEDFSTKKVNLNPSLLNAKAKHLDEYIYNNINNGVYKCGFATEQNVYESNVNNLFKSLEKIEQHLKTTKFLLGDSVTLSDIRLFVTLIRFDVVYYSHFKTDKKHIYEFCELWRYVKELYSFEEIQKTVNFKEIKSHYFQTHDKINPNKIIPSGPNILELLNK